MQSEIEAEPLGGHSIEEDVVDYGSLDDVRAKKKKLRHRALQDRAEFRRRNPGIETLLTHQLAKGLNKLKSEKGIWIGYVAMDTEADPRGAIDELGGMWAFPKIVNTKLSFYLMDPKSSWVKGPFGIYEPDPKTCQHIDMRLAEGVLVPGVAFDRFGNRLGRGRGYYDKALSLFPGHKVGVGYSVQLQDTVPFEEHDIRLNFIATEEQFLAAEGS